MKICLFEHYDDKSKELLQSLKTAGINTQNLFMRYDGQLPEGALCPFTYYTQEEDEETSARFYNQVEVPDLYEIRRNGYQSASIYNEGVLAGKINYSKYGALKVKSVEWFSPTKQTFKEELYNRSGRHYATNYFYKGKKYQTAYLKDKKEVLWENHINQLITVQDKGKTRQFVGIRAFFKFFMKEIGISNQETFLFNSVSHPLFVLRDLLEKPNAVCFHQDRNAADILWNLAVELRNPVAIKQIVFQSEEQYQKAKKDFPNTSIDLQYLSAIGETSRDNKHRLNAFTLSANHQLIDFTELLKAHPQITFCIAAKTEINPELLALAFEYDNLRCIQEIGNQELLEQLDISDIYLDINQGREVEGIVAQAYANGLLVFAQKSVAKRKDKSIVYESLEEINTYMSQLSTKESWDKLLSQQRRKGNRLSTIADYQELLS